MRAALLAALLVVGCSAPVGPVNPAQPFNAVAYAIRHSVHLDGCSAIDVGDGTIVTAKHCLPDEADLGDEYENGVITHISAKHDFAVFQRMGLSDSVALRNARIGEHVYVVGWPMQLFDGKAQLTVTDGLFAGPMDDERQSRITAPVYFGNSGGGVWGDDGALLGVAVVIYAIDVEGAYPLPYAGQSFMVPSKYLMAAL